MRWRTRLIRSWLEAALLSALVAGSASADLSEVDLDAPGDGLVTYDSATGLEWLDLTQTTNLSMEQILAGAGEWVSDGWRYATGAEVCGLLSPILVAPPADCGSLIDRYQASADRDAAIAMLGFIGATLPTGGGPNPNDSQIETIGVFDDGDLPFVGGAFIRIYDPQSFPSDVLIFRDQLGSTSADGSLGHWLVRMPEPGIGSMGLVALVTLRLLRGRSIVTGHPPES